MPWFSSARRSAGTPKTHRLAFIDAGIRVASFFAVDGAQFFRSPPLVWPVNSQVERPTRNRPSCRRIIFVNIPSRTADAQPAELFSPRAAQVAQVPARQKEHVAERNRSAQAVISRSPSTSCRRAPSRFVDAAKPLQKLQIMAFTFYASRAEEPGQQQRSIRRAVGMVVVPDGGAGEYSPVSAANSSSLPTLHHGYLSRSSENRDLSAEFAEVQPAACSSH